MKDKIANSAKFTKQKVSEGVSKTAEIAATTTSAVAGGVSEGVTNSAKFTKRKVSEGASKVAEVAATTTSTVAGGVSEGVTNSAKFTKQKVSEGASKVAEVAATTTNALVGGVSEGIANSAEFTKQKISEGASKATEVTAAATNAILATGATISIDQWMRSVFSGPATDYDRALDHIYTTLKQHGADHRLFDGSHDLVGAWKAVTQHVSEDAWINKAEGYVTALWKDVVTPKGLPIATWNKEAFDKTADFLSQTLGISRGWTKDMVTFTGTELIGATIGSIAIILAWKKEDIGRFTDVVAGLGLSAIIAANPIMTVVTIIGLARCFQKARKNRETLKSVLTGGGKGLTSTAAMIATTSLIPAPAWIAIVLGIVSYALIRKLYEKAELNSEELDKVLRKWFRDFDAVLSDVREKANEWSESKLVEDVQRRIKSCAFATAKTIETTWSTSVQSRVTLNYIRDLPPKLKTFITQRTPEWS